MKKVMVMGVGAQGSTVAKRLQEEPNVEEIICADYDLKAAQHLEKTLSKAKAVQVNAKNVADIVKAAEGCELIVNGLAPDFNMNVMDAALEVKACYQDLASGPVSDLGFIEAVERQLGRDQQFKDAGLAALTNTGSAPGVANILTREACDKFDTVDTITIAVYDGIWSKKFIPFWWSPETAFADMAAEPVVFENSKFKRVPPFNNPEMMDFVGLGERLMYDHEHEEPVTMGLLADKYLKGVKNVYFRYGGPGCDLAKYFYDMGLLSDKPIDIDGQQVVPMRMISKLTPPAPKYEDEIKAVIEEGMYMEEGAFLVRVEGKKDGASLRIDSYAGGPGLQEAFEKAGITHESYFTGQAAFLFTKMFVNDKMALNGVFPPEAFTKEMRAYYLKEAAKLDITVDEIIEKRLY
ncbi:MAG: saccharopine dehydrogenase NADP-binding domain-containing protein [Desulfobacterales bacterium]|nr:saccharopine dehydrogenase NADP-binding domain-containing protein [Desulfobacterales bacterium]